MKWQDIWLLYSKSGIQLVGMKSGLTSSRWPPQSSPGWERCSIDAVIIIARDLEIPEEMLRAAEEKQIAILAVAFPLVACLVNYQATRFSLRKELGSTVSWWITLAWGFWSGEIVESGKSETGLAGNRSSFEEDDRVCLRPVMRWPCGVSLLWSTPSARVGIVSVIVSIWC